MHSLDSLTTRVAAQPTVQTSIEALIHDLAERIKSTSNDQNVQRFAKDLKATAPALVRAIAGKPSDLPA